MATDMRNEMSKFHLHAVWVNRPGESMQQIPFDSKGVSSSTMI